MYANTMCFLKTVPYVLCDIRIMFIKRVYSEGTVIIKPAVVHPQRDFLKTRFTLYVIYRHNAAIGNGSPDTCVL